VKVSISFNSGTMAIVEAASVQMATHWARWEFGNANVRSGKEATGEELDWYLAWDGIIHQPVAPPPAPRKLGVEDAHDMANLINACMMFVEADESEDYMLLVQATRAARAALRPFAEVEAPPVKKENK